VPLTDFEDGVVAVAAGTSHSAAISLHGSLYTWGIGNDGRLGHGNPGVQELLPKLVVSLVASAVAEVSCGREHTMVRMADGRLLVFGKNARGQLGLGSSVPHTTMPVPWDRSTADVIRL